MFQHTKETFITKKNSINDSIQVRVTISDFGVFITICTMAGIDSWAGVRTPKLIVPDEFKPTWEGRGWVVSPFNNPWWTIPAAILPALLATILIFMDQQITAVIVNRRENKLKVIWNAKLWILSDKLERLTVTRLFERGRINRKDVATTWIYSSWPF